MKKLFSVVLLLALTLVLVGCTEDKDELRAQIETLQEQVLFLQEEMIDIMETQAETEDELDTKNGIIIDLHEEIADLQDQIEALQAATYDMVLTFEATDLFGNTVYRTMGVDETDELSLFDIAEDVYDLTYTTSEYGHFLIGIEDFEVPFGSYLAFYKNGTMSTVGIDDATYADGDLFTFQVEWYDATEQAVFEALHRFIDNQLANYLNEDYIDYNVLLGCQSLCDGHPVYERIVNDMQLINDYVEAMAPDTVQAYFKAIMIMHAVGYDDAIILDLVTDLSQIVATGPYGQTAYGLLALDSYYHEVDYSAYVTAALADLTTTTPYDLGLDSGGISLVALARYAGQPGIQDLIDDYVEWIQTDQLATGGIATRDMGWGTSENAASLAMVVLGLIANGIDPAGDDFTVTNGDTTTNLVLRLSEFQTDIGTFDWDLTDATFDDPMFSTPQAFLALATYYKHANDDTYTNPFDAQPIRPE